jgi:hypothetical protein
MTTGRYQAGDEVPIGVLCTDAGRLPANPDAAPRVAVYDASGHALADFALPRSDRAATTGLFAGRLFLGGLYPPGHYTLACRWTIGSFHGGRLLSFQVLPGGGDSGTLTALYHYERPGATHLINERKSGIIMRGRNPRASP